MRKAMALVALLGFGAPPAAAEIIPGSWIGYGNWSGAAYTDDNSGLFSHCAVSASYVSGDTLLLSVNRNFSVGVGVVNENFGLQPGQEFPVALFIDRREPFFGTGVAVSEVMAVLHVRDFERALDALRRGLQLTIQSSIGQGVYDLTGTFRALEAATRCAEKYFNYTAAAPSAGSPSIDRTLLFQIATEMISELQVRGFRYLSTAEAREFIDLDAVLWEAPGSGVSGGVLLMPSAGIDALQTTDGGDIAYITRNCRGDSATTARNLPASEGTFREIRAMCVHEGIETETLLTKFFVGNHVFYILLEFHRNNESPGERSTQRLSEGVVHRAAAYLDALGFSE